LSELSVLVTRTHPEAPPVQARAISRTHALRFNAGLICIAAAALLSILGIMAISTAYVTPREPDYVARQIIFLVIGVLSAVSVSFPHYARLRRYSYALLAAMLVLLIFVMIPAIPDFLVRPRNGARRWINVGITDFQPSEIAKIAFVFALANYLRLRKNYRRLTGLIVPFALTFVPMGLILIEPDLGTALLFLPTLFAMLIAAGAKLSHVALIIFLGCASAPMMYPFLKPHQKDRIEAMVKQLAGDTSHHDDIGFQGDRAQTLVASGRITGAGKEMATHLVRYNHLPEEHNDMIFAVIGARWGLFGGLSTIGLYLLFLGGGVLVAAMCREPFGRLVAVGFVTIIFAQMTINIGMTIGLLPITGMTLPFVSYGGSSLIANWLMAGVLLNIACRRPKPLEREPFEFDDDDAV